MAEDTTVVVFTSNNCRILKNPDNLDVIKDLPNVLVNPDFRYVKGIPPQYWTKTGSGELVGMGRYARPLREAHVEHYGADNMPNLPVSLVVKIPLYVRIWFFIKRILGKFV